MLSAPLNIRPLVVLYLIVLLIPWGIKSLHFHEHKSHQYHQHLQHDHYDHHQCNTNHQDDNETTFKEAAEHCIICEFQYLPFEKNSIIEIEPTTISYSECCLPLNDSPIIIAGTSVLLRAPPVG